MSTPKSFHMIIVTQGNLTKNLYTTAYVSPVWMTSHPEYIEQC